jgi:hypothetical protein
MVGCECGEPECFWWQEKMPTSLQPPTRGLECFRPFRRVTTAGRPLN